MQASLIRVKGLKPRVDVFSKKLHENMTRLWKDATKEFIVEAIKLVHIDTGMSRSSLLPLGRLVRMVTAIKAYGSRTPGKGGPVRKSRTGYTDLAGNYDPTINRTAALGEKLGERAFRLNFGSPARPVFHFEFNIKVYQYALHEEDWESIERGQEAFLAYLKNNAINYVPKLAEWILPETT
jgi:hypothetical protein